MGKGDILKYTAKWWGLVSLVSPLTATTEEQKGEMDSQNFVRTKNIVLVSRIKEI